MARTKGRIRAALRAMGGVSALAGARSTALFVGAYSLASTTAGQLSAKQSQDLWWIDLHFLPSMVALVGGIACSMLLVTYAIAPKMAGWRRVLTLVACAVLSLAALQNVTAFYRAWGAGSIVPGVPFPFSLVVAVVFALLGWAVWMVHPKKLIAGDHIAMAVGFVVLVALFPLAQIAFFGSSDYRAKADAAVVFGARVMDDGSLSPSLRDRVVTGVDLYKAGLVDKLVMSGGRGANGVDEPSAMRDAAVKEGVPSSAIVLDSKGLDTDATVRNTTAIFSRLGAHKVLAVSQGYHLPRVKLAYLAAGWSVRTVPAKEIEPIMQTPLFVAREIPAFWEYWARAFVRGIRGD